MERRHTPRSGLQPLQRNAISADSANDIWVVGSTFSAASDTIAPETLHYNGTTWTVVSVAQPSENSASLAAVTALSPTNVWAVGEDLGAGTAIGGNTLIEHYNGTAWKIVPSPTPASFHRLSGAPAARRTTSTSSTSTYPASMAARYSSDDPALNGTTWSVDNSGAFTGSLFAAATFAGSSMEWAMGVGSSNQGLVLSHG